MPRLGGYELGRLHISQNRVGCARCLQSFSVKDPMAKQWILSCCLAIGTSADQPTPIIHQTLHIGKQVSHITHHLMTYKGLIYCKKCGGFTSTYKLHKLAKPCIPPTLTGLAALKAISCNRKPVGIQDWPSDCNLALSRVIDQVKRLGMEEPTPESSLDIDLDPDPSSILNLLPISNPTSIQPIHSPDQSGSGSD